MKQEHEQKQVSQVLSAEQQRSSVHLLAMLGLGRTMGMMALWRNVELSRSSPSRLSSKRVSRARVSRHAGRPSAMNLLRVACTHKHAFSSARV